MKRKLLKNKLQTTYLSVGVRSKTHQRFPILSKSLFRSVCFFIFIGWISHLVLSCSEPPPPSLRYEDREVVDSLFNVEYDKLKDSLDSMCNRIKETTLQTAVDSILLVRLKEIAKQKSRYQQ